MKSSSRECSRLACLTSWLLVSPPRPAVTQQTARQTAAPPTDMDYIIPLILLALCAWASAYEPLAMVIQRRRNAYPIYASDFVDEYEPYAVAAFPVHAPMPIFQVISPTAYTAKLRKQVKRPQPNRDLHAYASSNIEQAYEPYAYEHAYEDSVPQKYKGNPYDEEASSVVVYARPNKNGGYSYRKPPTPTPTPAPHPQREPIIIRIHKYRVVH